jgi:hypothetical protein
MKSREGGKELHKEELRHVYSLPSIIRIIKRGWGKMWAGHVARMVEKRNVYRIL